MCRLSQRPPIMWAMSASPEMPGSPGLAELQLRAEAAPGDFFARMNLGAALHAAGLPERALAAFEKALAISPGDTNAASACAALMLELSRPQAAYRLLQSMEPQLRRDADGAANLAIAAEACGEDKHAKYCYEQALVLNPDHLRARNNLALMAAREGLWDIALAHARHCLSLQPQELAFWVNLSDVLTGSRRYPEALAHLSQALQQFPGSPELSLRRAVVLAFNAEFEESRDAFAALSPEIWARVEGLLALAPTVTAYDSLVQKPPASMPDPYQLYTRAAFEALQACDWREHDRLTETLRHLLAHALRSGTARDLRDAQYYGIALALPEDELAQICEVSIAAIAASFKKTIPSFVAHRSPHRDERIHVGMAIQSLRDPRFANGLARQLRLHDASRFCLHLYSPTPQPQEYLAQALGAPAGHVVEIAHLTDDEAVGRMRFDQLDIFLDMTFGTPWCRPEIPARRVAPVQIRQLTWHRHHPAQPCEYNLSDTFVHPEGADLARYGAIVRLPHTCWLDANDDMQPSGPSLVDRRTALGLPGDSIVLCAFLPAFMIDPQTFATWMQMLRALPDAVLWLPAYSPAIQDNLAREAGAAGVRTSRLVFSGHMTRPDMLARMQLADLFVDALRFNANHGLVDALRMGVPAISCAGNSMASRLGGSIIRAAGLPNCVFENPSAYLAAGIALGRDAGKLTRLRQQLQAARPIAPLFDVHARVREWEAAWTVMAERSRAGLPPAAFDVPPHRNPESPSSQ